MTPDWEITEYEGGVQFRIKVQPRTDKNEFAGTFGNALKVRLTAPPVDGEANEACIRFLAKSLGIARNRIRIVTGQTNPHKLLRVEGLDKNEFLRRLGKI